MSKNHNSFKNLFDNVVSIDNLEEAFYKTQKTETKYKIDSINFSMNLYENLIQLKKELIGGKYTPQDYNVFKVYEPKERIIAAPKYKDKLVQFALHNILNPIFEQKFIYDSYSCINEKGTHSCAKKIQKMLAKAKWRFDDPWIIKADISKFFYSIDHDILKTILRKKIKCKRTLKLLELIIDYSPNKVGLPLGNITSQLFANIYLNELDQFCKRKLSLKFYARYMDDFLAIVDSRKMAKETKYKMKKFVDNNLNLIFNPKKSKIFPISQGLIW